MGTHSDRAKALGNALQKFEGKIRPTYSNSKVRIKLDALSKKDRTDIIATLLPLELDWELTVKDGKTFSMSAGFREPTYNEYIRPIFNKPTEVIFYASIKPTDTKFSYKVMTNDVKTDEGTRDDMGDIIDYLQYKISKSSVTTVEATINAPKNIGTKLTPHQKVIKGFLKICKEETLDYTYDDSDDTLYFDRYLKMKDDNDIRIYKRFNTLFTKNLKEMNGHEISVDSGNDGTVVLKEVYEGDYEIAKGESTNRFKGKYTLKGTLNNTETIDKHNLSLLDSKGEQVYHSSSDNICNWNSDLQDLFHYRNIKMDITVQWKGFS